MISESIIFTKIIRIFIVFLPFLFLFLQSFYIPGTNIPFYDIIIGFSLILLILFYPKLFIQYFNNKDTYYKILWLYIAWVFLSGIILVLTGKYGLTKYLYGVIALFFYNNITWYIYPSILNPRFLSLKKIIRYLLIATYLVCLYGLLVYLFNIINLNIFEPLQNIIVNRREFINTGRVISVFEEPGFMGGFICVNIPIVYNAVLSNFKIFKNNNFDIFFKLSFLPLYIITIILVQSPIWLLVFVTVNFIYFRKKIIKYYKTVLFILFTALIFVVTIANIGILSDSKDSRAMSNRIVNFVNNSGKDLVYVDESLATRIIGYNTRVKIFLQYPITGIGYKNAEYYAYKIFEKEKYMLTAELRQKISNLRANNKYIVLNGSIFWNLLSDTGIIGTLLFYLFVICSISKLNKIEKNLPDMFIKQFIKGLKQTYILIICFSIYDIRSNFVYFWFLFGMTIPCVYYYKQFNNKMYYLFVNKGLKNEYQ